MDNEGRRSHLDELLSLAHLLISRLERLSVDSYWAHQASGVRGALLRQLEESGSESSRQGRRALGELIALGFEILERGAKDMRAGSQGRDIPGGEDQGFAARLSSASPSPDRTSRR